jgi:hypothetical protein
MSISASLHLANAASLDVGGTVNALGFGWRITGPSPLPGYVILVLVGMSEDEAGKQIPMVLQLVDEHGSPVTQGDDRRPVRIETSVEASLALARPPGLASGATLIAELGAGVSLEPGYYEWVLSLGGETRDEWRYKFYVRAKADEYPPGAEIRAPGAPLK